MYAVPYITVVAALGVMAVFYEYAPDSSTRRKLTLCCYILLLFFFGFRGFVADDWQIYYAEFQKCSVDSLSFNIVNTAEQWDFEPGFTLFMFLSKSLFNNYFFFQFLCTIVNLVLLHRFFKDKVSNHPFALVLFICFGGYVMMTNLLRNSIAILIFANALPLIQQRKVIPYFLLCTLAVTFHSSSFTYFPVYFLFRYKYSRWFFLALFLAGNLFFLLHVKVFIPITSMILGDESGMLQDAVTDYTTGEMGEATRLSIGYLERLFTGLLIFGYYNRLEQVRADSRLYVNCFMAYFCMVFFLSEFEIMSQRMANLFIMSYWILWGDLIKSFVYKNNKHLFVAFISVYCTLKLVGMTNLVTSDYDNILFGSKSYQERQLIHRRTPKVM